MNLLSILDNLDRTYLRSSPVGLAALGASSAYYVAFSYGAGVTFLVLGRERGAQVFTNAANHPALILLGIPLIPVMLVSLEAYDLEGRYDWGWGLPVSRAIIDNALLIAIINSVT